MNRISGHSHSKAAQTHVHIGHILGKTSKKLEHLFWPLVGYDHGSVGVDDSSELGETNGEGFVL